MDGTNEENKAFGWGREARSDGMYAMNDGSFEINIEYAEHVDGMKNDSQYY